MQSDVSVAVLDYFNNPMLTATYYESVGRKYKHIFKTIK
jgi:hypothetical protein